MDAIGQVPPEARGGTLGNHDVAFHHRAKPNSTRSSSMEEPNKHLRNHKKLRRGRASRAYIH